MVGKPRSEDFVGAVAKVIDELICSALHLRDITGASPHKYFMSHPMKTNHNVIDDTKAGQTHQFYLTGPSLELQVMAHDGRIQFVTVLPQGEFVGAIIQSSKKGRYLVRLELPLSGNVGASARRLVNKFVEAFEAVDVTT